MAAGVSFITFNGWTWINSLLSFAQRYAEAEEAFKMVLKLDEGCEEALKEIHTCQVFQLMVN